MAPLPCKIDWRLLIQMFRNHGMMAADVAKVIGVPKTTIHNYRGKRDIEPRYETGAALLNTARQVLTDEELSQCLQ